MEIGYLGVFRCAEFKSDVCFWFGEIFKSVYCCTDQPQTKTMIKFQRMIALCTFIFETIPILALILSAHIWGNIYLKEIEFFGHFLFIIVDNQYTIRNLNPLSNIIIYMNSRHYFEFRTSDRQIFSIPYFFHFLKCG